MNFGEDYIPTRPYRFRSGVRAGMYMEEMMFADPLFLIWYLDLCIRETSTSYKNKAHKHLEWLMARGEDRKPQMMCSYCQHKEIVKYFTIRFNSQDYEPSFGINYTYCENCVDMFTHSAFGNVQRFEFKWSIIKYLNDLYQEKVKTHIGKIMNMYKEVFVLPDTLNDEMAFEFFRSVNQAPDNIYY